MSVNGYDGQNLIEYASRTAVDPVPTENSVRPVSSNGVFEALEGKADFIDLGTYKLDTYPTNTDFVNGVASYIKSHFSNVSNSYANIKYIRNGSWTGTMEYSPYQNGYISILAHYYQPGYIVHFGTVNGAPFYHKIEEENIKSGTVAMTYDSKLGRHFTSIDISVAMNEGWRPKSIICYNSLSNIPLTVYSIDYNGKKVNLITVNPTSSDQSISANYLIDFYHD